VSDACTRSDVSRNAPVRTRQIQEDGKEVLLILDSDSEGEDIVALPGVRDGEDGMSSDTAVGDPNFSDFDSGGEEDDPDLSSDVNFSAAGRTFSLCEPGTRFAGYHGWSCPRNTFYSKWYGFWWYVFGNSCL
jgi:hypothetical protein